MNDMVAIDAEDEGIDIEALVTEISRDVKDAQDFLDDNFGDDRTRAERYYNGESDVKVQGNRSRYVATKVRDTIRGVRPSIMRAFFGSVTPVEFLPSNKISAPLARQQTMYVAQEFTNAGGYRAIYDAAQNAMLHKVGPVQYWWETQVEEDYRTYTNLTTEQAQMLQQNPNVRIISAEPTMIATMGPSGEVQQEPLYTVDMAYQTRTGRLRVEPVLLSELIIDEGAVNGRPPLVIGKQVSMTVSDVLKTYPEVDPDQVMELNNSEPEVARNSGEARNRRRYARQAKRQDSVDPSMKRVLITDVYRAADLDGTGIAQMWRWVLGGTSLELLYFERAEDGHNFALFQIDPKPGAVFGNSLYDLTHSDQDGITSATRGVINNLHASNHPRIAYHETMVNADDVQNWDIGAPIRFRQPGMLQEVAVPFVGGQVVPFIEYWNNDVENKTGVSRASLGLDPRALQSTDKQAVANTIQSGAGQTEVMVRNLAETGMVPLFQGILRLCMRHQDPQQVVWVTGEKYIPVDLRNFDPTLCMQVNVGLGGGDDEKRVMGLEKVMALQEKIIGQFGPTNPVVQPYHVTQTMEDYIKALGFKDVSRYIKPMTEDESKKVVEGLQAQASQPPPPDPQVEAFKQTEAMKASQKAQQATLEADLKRRQSIVDAELQMGKVAQEDDLARDKMAMDMYIAAGQLAVEGGKLETERIKAQQAATKPTGTVQ
jgi:hypothetical protein